MMRFSNKSHQTKTEGMLFSSVRRGGDNAADAIEAENCNNSNARGISFSLFLTYLTVMGAKCALPSTLSMLTSPISGLAHHNAVLSRQDVISRLLALSTVSIATGKLLLGPLIDTFGGVLSLQIALSTLFICLGCIGFGTATCPTLTAFAIYWIVVDFAFSSCWAACVKTIRDCLSEKNWAREIGRLAMAARTGNAIGFAFFASLLQWKFTGVAAQSTGPMNTSWRRVFRAAGLIQLIPLLMLTYFGGKGDKKSQKMTNSYKQDESKTTSSSLNQSLTILRYQSRRPEFWLHLISRSLIMVLVSFLLFIPSFMTQCYGMSSASSARVGSLFALGCLLAVSTLAERTYPSVAAISSAGRTPSINLHRRKAYFMLAFLATAAICLLIQTAFLRDIIHLTPLLGSLLMFLFGFSLGIPFYLPSTMFALKNGGKDGSATIADAFDVCGFGLLAVFNGLVARVLDVKTKRAWLPVLLWMLGGSIVAMTSMFQALWLEGGERE
ncbi:hypothetical protein ACHAW5_001357 [Stephanodiscus triporus]|uniref:MFS general substrate transporter n=1 Tax=Stephanodiscus triporus TaxID=2934178 RepID=A0ABD3MRN6_9STRA